MQNEIVLEPSEQNIRRKVVSMDTVKCDICEFSFYSRKHFQLLPGSFSKNLDTMHEKSKHKHSC